MDCEDRHPLRGRVGARRAVSRADLISRAVHHWRAGVANSGYRRLAKVTPIPGPADGEPVKDGGTDRITARVSREAFAGVAWICPLRRNGQSSLWCAVGGSLMDVSEKLRSINAFRL